MDKTVLSYYLQRILYDGISFTTPFITIYLLSFISLGDVLVLNAIQVAVTALLEIPSGVFADIIGRKEAVIVGVVCNAASVLFFILGSSISYFAVAFMLAGAGVAMFSGSHDSLVYESLEKEKKTHEAIKVFAKLESYSAHLTDISYLLASGIAAISLKLVFGMEFLKWCVVFALAVLVPGAKRKFSNNFEVYKLRVRDSLKFVIDNRNFALIMVAGAVSYSIFMVSANFYQPLMSAAGVNVALFGIVYIILNQARGFSSRLAVFVEKRKLPGSIFMWIMAAKSVALILLAVFVNPVIVVALLITKVGAEWIRRPFFTSYLVKGTPKRIRVTVLSISSMIQSLFFVVLSVILRFVTDSYSMYAAILVSGVLSLALIPMFRSSSHAFTSRKS